MQFVVSDISQKLRIGVSIGSASVRSQLKGRKRINVAKERNALLNIIRGLGYWATGERILGIGLLIALPFLHWPLVVGNWALYLTYPFMLVLIGHLILTAIFLIDAYYRTPD